MLLGCRDSVTPGMTFYEPSEKVWARLQSRPTSWKAEPTGNGPSGPYNLAPQTAVCEAARAAPGSFQKCRVLGRLLCQHLCDFPHD